ncbi:hypothetical protein CL55_00003120 [Polynucleobacter duraquae]|uniref:Uncharacterized protein n=2 Tax=Polynucleobacter duraquae TaxID=1835254 RepID=A0A0E3ZKI8_9BURK|nr:hypothetical protein CL55_00003120 [Polynucleobacter duraquae]
MRPNNTSLKILLFFFSNGILFISFYFFASFWIERSKKYYLIPESFANQIQIYQSEDASNFRKKFNTQLDHIRSYYVLGENIPITEMLFTVINPFSSKKLNILLQGDSWGEQATSSNEIKQILNSFATKNKVGFVSAGIGSYAPTPETLQLRALRDNFNIHPNIVILIIDQTDIGDELYRYRHPVTDTSGKKLLSTRSDSYAEPHQDALLSIDKSNILKSEVNIFMKFYRYSTVAIKGLIDKEAGANVLAPLEKGVSPTDKDLFISRVRGYINEFFVEKSGKKLYIVTHPHRNHLLPADAKNAYKVNVADLVQVAIDGSSHHESITHLNINKVFKSVYEDFDGDNIFEPGDPASHLSRAAYRNNFLPYILNQIVLKQ